MSGPFVRYVPVAVCGALAIACSAPSGAASEDTQNELISRGLGDGGAQSGDAGAAPDAAPAEPPDVPIGATWLAQANIYRRAAKLAPVSEDPSLNEGAAAHARYIVLADKVTHDEDPASPYYSKKGDESGRNSDVLGTDRPGRYDTSIDNFAKAPFHALLLLNPSLVSTGYGEFFQAGAGFTYAAVLDIRHGVGKGKISDDIYPILFPADGATIPVKESVTEYPDPLASCPSYADPAGLPIVVQFEPGDDDASVTSHGLTLDGAPVAHCVFDAKTYVNAKDPTGQSLGRALLKASNAVVIVPKSPLVPKATYAVSLATGKDKLNWSFRVANNAH